MSGRRSWGRAGASALAAWLAGPAAHAWAQPEDEPGAIEVDVRAEPPRAPTELARDPSAPGYVLRTERLAAPGASLADALGRAPGVEARRTGGAGDLATASIRGATSAQTPVYLAGLRLNDDLTGTADLSALPPWMLDRVEIYRGHAPRGAGELALGGAILLEPRLPTGPRLSVRSGLGSFGAAEGAGAASFGSARAGALLAVRRARETGDYPYLDDGGTLFDPGDDVERRRPNADVASDDVWAVARLAVGRSGSLALVANAFARDAGLPGLLVSPAERARAHLARGLGALAARLDCPGVDAALGCALGLELGVLVSRYRLDDPGRELGLGAASVSHAGTRLAPRAWLTVAPLPELDLGVRLGAEAGDLAVGSLRAARRSVRATLDADLHPVAWLDVLAIASLECHATRASGPGSTGTSGSGTEPSAAADAGPCDELEPLGRLGARVRLWSREPAPDGVRTDEPEGSLALLANLGRYARVPTLAELHGLSGAVRGNPELLAERGYAADLGLAASLHVAGIDVYAQLFGYLRFASELIAYRRSSLGVLRPYNAASARLLGAELAAGAGLGRELRLELVAAAGDARDTSAERATASDLVPLEPRLALGPALESELALGPPGCCALSLRVAYRYRASRTADPAGLVVLPAQHDLEQELGLALLDRALSLRARVSNLLDERHFDLVGYPLAGRAAHASLEATW
ncbi:MAG: TonB-dependent receptor [Polyangiaceae bacterium]|nr:TonB-dependent receptor [Polyangiaceae bacterium]